MAEDSGIEEKPPFDLERAKTLIGKLVLIGLTYYDHDGNFLEQKQMHGRISSVDGKKGLAIALEGSRNGETYWLPPDLRSFREAKPGEYREHSTGEVVVNPDLTTTWEITQTQTHSMSPMYASKFPISKLTRDEFASALQKGLGRAFLHVKHYGLDDFADLVLKACLHDQAYDPKLNRVKPDGYLRCLKIPGNMPSLVKLFSIALKKRETWDLQRFFELAEEMAKNGDEQAREAVKERAFKKASKGSMDDWMGAVEWTHLAGIEGALDIARYTVNVYCLIRKILFQIRFSHGTK